MADKCGVNTLDLAARLEASPKTIYHDRNFIPAEFVTPQLAGKSPKTIYHDRNFIRDRLQIELEYTIYGDKTVFRAKDPSMIPELCKFLARFR